MNSNSGAEVANGPISKMPNGFISPGVAPKCTWALGKDFSLSPHQHLLPNKVPNVSGSILPNVLEMVGNTPMIRLDKIAKSEGLQCDLLAKCEFLNAGGSLKDRVAMRMVLEAERDGILKPGDTIIEPTSGNTGIGLALISAVKGYKCIICIPERMSNEKVSVLHALGADVRRTPNGLSIDHPESKFGLSWRLKEEIPNSHVLDQYRNSSNPLSHYDGTAIEILTQCEGKVDMVVGGGGTGGTISGIGRKLKEVLPSVQIICVDPVGSLLAQPEELNEAGKGTSFKVEGIGKNYIPTVFDRSIVDRWFKCEDKETFQYARRLIREEGLLCGGSSGAIVAAAVKAAKSLKAGQRCVVILPDSIRNYLTKFVDDKWLLQNGLKDPEGPFPDWWKVPVSSLSLGTPITIAPETTCAEAVQIMKKKGISQIPVVDKQGNIAGVVTSASMTSKLCCKGVAPTDPVSKILVKNFPKLDSGTSANLGKVSLLLEKEQYVVIMKTKLELEGVVTSIDLSTFICDENH